MTKIVGLTGGIGSGKSTVLNFFKTLGAETFVADQVAKALLNSDEALKIEVIKNFGEEAYKNGVLDRKFLATAVFNDKRKLEILNGLVHPRVRKEFILKSTSSTAKVLIYEAAILFESGSHELCDYIVLVTADKETRINRVVKRDSVTPEQVEARMQHQSEDLAHLDKVDFVIRNNDLSATEAQVSSIFELLLKFENK